MLHKAFLVVIPIVVDIGIQWTLVQTEKAQLQCFGAVDSMLDTDIYLEWDFHHSESHFEHSESHCQFFHFCSLTRCIAIEHIFYIYRYIQASCQYLSQVN